MEHLTGIQLEGFRDGMLTGGEYLHVLAHIGGCDSCAEQLACLVEEQPLLRHPAGLKAAVMKKRLEPGEDAIKSYRLYRRRVLIAMCATLILVFSGVFTQFGRIPVDKISQANVSITERIKDGFSAFSQKLWITEDGKHEQTKK